MTIRVLVVDDQPLIRTAVRGLLEHEEDMLVVGEADNGRDAVEAALAQRPDIICMDIRMPVMNGIDATRRICDDPDLAGARVLILTTFEEDEYVANALRAGASGFVGKGAQPAELAEAIRVVHSGESLLSPKATRALIDRYLAAEPADRVAGVQGVSLAPLTDREREVLALVAQGLSNTEIADELTISPLTAKTHVNRTMAKLYAHDRAQLVIAAYESGLVRPSTGRTGSL